MCLCEAGEGGPGGGGRLYEKERWVMVKRRKEKGKERKKEGREEVGGDEGKHSCMEQTVSRRSVCFQIIRGGR